MTRMLTTAKINKLNKSNRAAQDAALGTMVSKGVISGSLAVTSAQATASAISIDTGLNFAGFMVQVFRSGSAISASAIYAQPSSSSLVVLSKDAGFKITANDLVNYIVF